METDYIVQGIIPRWYLEYHGVIRTIKRGIPYVDNYSVYTRIDDKEKYMDVIVGGKKRGRPEIVITECYVIFRDKDKRVYMYETDRKDIEAIIKRGLKRLIYRKWAVVTADFDVNKYEIKATIFGNKGITDKKIYMKERPLIEDLLAFAFLI